MGIKGASYATCLTYFLLWITITVVVSFNQDLKEAWIRPNRETFRNLPSYLRIAIPGTLMLCFEFWVYEFFTLLAGYLSIEATASEIILLNLSTTLYMIPLGM
jgi:MATE family multidrug resistance protein